MWAEGWPVRNQARCNPFRGRSLLRVRGRLDAFCGAADTAAQARDFIAALVENLLLQVHSPRLSVFAQLYGPRKNDFEKLLCLGVIERLIDCERVMVAINCLPG